MTDFTEYDFNPRNLPPKLLAAIGLVVQCAAQTDDILNAAIGGCLGLDAEYTIAVTAHMSIPLKKSVLLSAAEIRIDDLDALDELDALASAVDNAMGKRNDAAHDSFCVNPKTQQVFRVKQRARTNVEMTLEPVDIAHIIKDASLIYNAGMDLMGFVQRHNLLPPFPSARARGHKTKAARKARRTKLGK